MPLSAGVRLGPYEIVAPLGAGGMGEVYRARDTRLGRDVAVKVLPQHLSDNPEVRARFEREAKTISSLNHPNICTLFDVGRVPGEAGSGDIDYLVMELVEGETLSQRLGRVGVLPGGDVLRLGSQIADALDRAHRAGVIHRDLKPGNIMITKSGAKLMDFGLARATGLTAPGSSGGTTLQALTQSPTVAAPLTAEGTIVGTFQYMAPEQLEGREADARTDLWALGCVLYEMASGRRAFEGRSQATLISAIISGEPRPLLEISPLTPPALERVIKQCLAKDPDDRWQSAGDVRREMQWIAGSSGASATSVAGSPRPPGRRPIAAAALVASAVLATLAVTITLWQSIHAPHERSGAAILELRTSPAATLSPEAADLAISPDGRLLAYIAADTAGVAHLWVRALDSPNGRMIAETDRAQRPFWSPDSRWIGYFTLGQLSSLMKVALTEGTPIKLCDVEWSRGATWGRHGDILFVPAPTTPVMRISENGGAVTAASAFDTTRQETSHRYPSFLPDGDHFVYVALPSIDGGWSICLASLHSRSIRRLGVAMSAATWVEPGYLLFDREGHVVARRLDLARGALVGDMIPISSSAPRTTEDATRVASGSATGRLAMLRRDPALVRLEWLDRAGTLISRPPVPAGDLFGVALSHGGRRLLLTRLISRFASQALTVDLDRGIITALTDVHDSNYPTCWSPDDRLIAMSSVHNAGHEEVGLIPSDGSGPVRILPTDGLQFKTPVAWSPDSRYLLINQIVKGSQRDLRIVDSEHGGAPRPFISDPGDQLNGSFSPDGHWVVYDSDESGTSQLYARRFPEGTDKIQLTTAGGAQPRWIQGGREIVYQGVDGRSIYSLSLEAGSAPAPHTARLLFRASYDLADESWDVTPDGQRFMTLAPAQAQSDPSITIVTDWPALLERH